VADYPGHSQAADRIDLLDLKPFLVTRRPAQR
jgi:hypothetical protein